MKFFNFFIKSKKTFIFGVFILLSSIGARMIFADNMQSSSYKMQSDSLNFGGVDSTSSGYKLSDTLGEVATGDSNSSSYLMHAGFWQMQESFISISSPLDAQIASINGLTGGANESSISWLVTTDSPAGYSMTVAANTTPALKSIQDSFDDYSPTGVDPDYNFTNPADSSSFGFSPEGIDVTARFKDNGSICNSGSLETPARCWDGLSITPKQIAQGSSSNMPDGIVTSVRLKAESGTNHIQVSGQYNSVITVTAVTL